MSALVSMAQQFSGLPMDDLIGAPLKAATNANNSMALTQTKFMLDTCFTKEVDGDTTNYKPIIISMQLERGVLVPAVYDDTGAETTPAKIDKVTTSFNLPLLTVVPLNSLAVDEVDIKFEMEVKSSFSEDTAESQTTTASAEASFSAGIGPVSISGSASYSSEDNSSRNTHYEKSNSAKYNLHIHAGQLPMPTGVTTIIDAFSKSIEPVTMPTAEQSS